MEKGVAPDAPDRQPLATVAGLFPGVEHLLLNLGRCLTGSVVWTARSIAKAGVAKFLVTTHPLTHDVAGCMPQSRGLTVVPRPLVGLH